MVTPQRRGGAISEWQGVQPSSKGSVQSHAPVTPASLCHRDLSTGFPLWLMFLNKRPLRAEASTTWGVGFSPSLAQTPALATGPALKQEERKSLLSGEKPGSAAITAKHHALWGWWVRPRPCLRGAHPYSPEEAAALGRDLGR